MLRYAKAKELRDWAVAVETTVTRMLNLLGSRSVRSGKIFDVFLVATMLDNGVRRIYTENIDDFERIDGIEAINPFAS